MPGAVGVLNDPPLRSLKGLAGPRGSRLSGNLGAFESGRLAFLLQTRTQFGRLVRFDGATTIVNDARLAQYILIDRAQTYGIQEDLLGRHLSTDAVGETRSLRPALNPAMRRRKAVAIQPLLSHRLSSELELLQGRSADPLPILERVVSAAVAAYYFGSRHEQVTGPLRGLLDELDNHFGNTWAVPAWWRTPRHRRIRTAYERAEAAVADQLHRRESSPDAWDDLAADVLKRVRIHAPQTTTRRTAQLIVGSLLAAQRVPAAAAAWMLHEVAASQRHQESARHEILQRRVVTRAEDEAVWQSPVALGIVLETLRLHPPTWLLHRRALRATALDGYRVPRGHNFLLSPYVLHRDPAAFRDPEAFVPERWRGVRTIPTSMFPFGRGPYGCPGEEIALGIMQAVLVTCLEHYEMRSVSDAVRPDPRSTMVPAGLRLRFEAIRS